MSTSLTGIADAILKARELSVKQDTPALSGMSRIARDLGLTHQAVHLWSKQGFVPLSRVIEIEALYGIPRARLVHPKYVETLRAASFDIEE